MEKTGLKVRFYNGAGTDEPHIFKHKVTEDEALDVLAMPMEERKGNERSTVVIGQTAGGRYLKVIYTDVGGELLVITAYDLRGKALKAFRRRMKP